VKIRTANARSPRNSIRTISCPSLGMPLAMVKPKSPSRAGKASPAKSPNALGEKANPATAESLAKRVMGASTGAGWKSRQGGREAVEHSTITCWVLKDSPQLSGQTDFLAPPEHRFDTSVRISSRRSTGMGGSHWWSDVQLQCDPPAAV
jgi:hypothetical protein